MSTKIQLRFLEKLSEHLRLHHLSSEFKVIGFGSHGHVQKSENHENEGFSGSPKMNPKTCRIHLGRTRKPVIFMIFGFLDMPMISKTNYFKFGTGPKWSRLILQSFWATLLIKFTVDMPPKTLVDPKTIFLLRCPWIFDRKSKFFQLILEFSGSTRKYHHCKIQCMLVWRFSIGS